MPRQAKSKVDSTILEMAIVGYQSEIQKISLKIADIKTQLGQHGQQSGPRQDCRRAESQMGGAEAATGTTIPAGEAQEAEVVGGRFESHKGSHEKALGGIP